VCNCTDSARYSSQADGEERLSRADIQRRANQLARALHILDRTQHALIEVGKQTNLFNAGAPAQPGSIQAYFGSNNADSPAIDVDIPDKSNNPAVAETGQACVLPTRNASDGPTESQETIDLTCAE
jgi:hypothetical protein